MEWSRQLTKKSNKRSSLTWHRRCACCTNCWCGGWGCASCWCGDWECAGCWCRRWGCAGCWYNCCGISDDSTRGYFIKKEKSKYTKKKNVLTTLRVSETACTTKVELRTPKNSKDAENSWPTNWFANGLTRQIKLVGGLQTVSISRILAEAARLASCLDLRKV